jgi:putative oxidoreductase
MGPDATMPGLLQACAALSEFGGGALWVLGLLTPLACLGLLVTMSVAVMTHMGHGDPFVRMDGPGPAYELAAAYLSVSLLLLFAGPGRFSIDAIIAKPR